MSSRPNKDKPSKREVLQAMEGICMSLAIWHGAKGSIAEGYCDRMVAEMAECIFKGAKPAGMLMIQQAVLQLVKEEAERIERGNTGEPTMVGMPTAARQESGVAGEQVDEGRPAVDVPEPGGEGVESRAGLKLVVDDEGAGMDDDGGTPRG